VRVTTNSQGKWEIYLRAATNTWERVGLQNGTIELSSDLWDYQSAGYGWDAQVFDSQYFDQEPVIETRKIIQAINQELLVDELLIERNRALMLMFNFALSEFEAPEWLTKTSLIDVDHTIRELLAFQTYRQDNQDFVVDYIKEVKPYHVQIREFNLIYNGLDDYQGSITDFDVPAYYDTDVIPNQFVSPVLTPYTVSTATGTGTASDISDAAADSLIWQTQPWNFWYQNYTLAVVGAVVADAGSGYTVPPVATVTGDCITPAELTVNINSLGKLTGVTVINPGVGYTTTALITLDGGNGTGGQLVAVMAGPGVGINQDPTLPTYGDTQYYNLVRSFDITMKYDRYQYVSTIVDWEPNVNYDNGTQVRYDNRVWEADSSDSTGVESATFDPLQWNLVNAATLSGVDRTMGLYVPTVNEPGLDLGLLIDGITYPGVQVSAPTFNQNTGWDVGNWDVNPWDNIAYGPEGRPTYDPSILDTIYESRFLDVYLGVRPTDINVVGGEFVGPYESHAPEELVPGSEFDTMDFRVYTQPGADWSGDGHGFAWKIVKWTYDNSLAYSYSFNGLITNPVQVLVTNQTQRRDLAQDIAYTVDWVSNIVTIIPSVSAPPAANGDVLVISVFGLGGGNQLYNNSYNGADVGNQLNIPVAEVEIFEMAIFVNGILIHNYTYTSGTNNTTNILFGNTYTSTDQINVTAIGATDGSQLYSWSTPKTQYFVSTGQLDYMLDNAMTGTNIPNLVVEVNGIRARPPEGAFYIADGSSGYALPTRGGYSLELVTNNDVLVYVNDQLQLLGINYTLEPYTDDGTRYVDFTVAPSVGSEVLICVTLKADYEVVYDDSTVDHYFVIFRTDGGFYPQYGDIVSVTSWNDTSQQSIVTLLWQGPITTAATVNEPYDSTDFDVGTVLNDPGSFDYTQGVQISVNDFQLGRIVTDPTRIWVTKNGNRLFNVVDFTISGEQLVLTSGVIGVADVVVAELFTNSVVPEAMEFRIFQDMRGIQATYRMTPDTTTTLVQPLLKSQDIIYVDNAGALTQPNLEANIWGVITINGERIMYRILDLDSNTVSSLQRGTAGTAAADHGVNSIVYNLGRGNLAPAEYQDRIVYTNTLADGSTTTFSAPNIDLSALTLSFAEQAILVYVAGIRVYTGYTIDSVAPASITFDIAPTDGYEVSIRVRQGFGWYQPANGNPSDGQALQVTQTDAARFFRGQN
jgi:hypothetical protein